MNTGVSQYRTMEVTAMSPAGRVVALYSFIVAQLRQAQFALDAGEIEAGNRNMVRAQDGIGELLLALNREAGGEFADRLSALYGYFLKELLEISVHADGIRLQRLTSMISTLHAAWSEAAQSGSQPTGVTVAANG